MSKLKRIAHQQSYRNESLLSLFTCKKQIGRGVTSRVYKMTHNITHQSYALKEVGMYDQENIECVLKEKGLKHINHQNLLTYEYLFIGKRPLDLERIKKFDNDDSRPSSTAMEKEKKSDLSNAINFCLSEDQHMIGDNLEYDLMKTIEEHCLNTLNSNNSIHGYFKETDKISSDQPKNVSYNKKLLRKASAPPVCNFKSECEIKRKDYQKLLKNKERRYCYFISEYCEFTLRDFIDIRNDYFFNNKNGYSGIECTNKEKICNMLTRYNSEDIYDLKTRDAESPMCFLDIETIAVKGDQGCYRGRSASTGDLKEFRNELLKNKTAIETKICKAKRNNGKCTNQDLTIKSDCKNRTNQVLHDKKLVSYDTFGIKKRIPSCYLKASFTPQMQVNPIFFIGLIKELLKGLIFLHQHCIAHNDIKASNVFFNSDLIPKIGDFGMINCGSDYENLIFDHRQIKFKFKDKVSDYEYCNDLKQIGYLFFEMLWPMKTAMEKYKILSELEIKNVLPVEFRVLYPDLSSIISDCLVSYSGSSLTAESIYERLCMLECK